MFRRSKRLILCLLLSAFCLGTQTHAENKPANLPDPPPLPEEMRNRAPLKPPPNLPNPADLMDQLRQLQELIAMSPEKLARLRKSIEFIERMSLEERESMRIRLSQVTRLNNELEVEVNSLHNLSPAVRKTDLTQFWIASSENQRDAVRNALKTASNEKKRAEIIEKSVQSFVKRREATLARIQQRIEEARSASPSPPQ